MNSKSSCYQKRGHVSAIGNSLPLLLKIWRALRTLPRYVSGLPLKTILRLCEVYLKYNKNKTLSGSIKLLEYQLSIESDQTKRLAKLLREPLNVLDVGARHGPSSHLKSYKDYLCFVVCEPEPEEAQILRSLGYQVVEEAVAERSGDATLYVTKKRGGASLLPPGGLMEFYAIGKNKKREVEKTLNIKTTSIDDICQRLTHKSVI